jgi:hypothetical protein
VGEFGIWDARKWIRVKRSESEAAARTQSVLGFGHLVRGVTLYQQERA